MAVFFLICCCQHKGYKGGDSYFSMALHQHNVTDNISLYIVAGVYKMARAEGAGEVVDRLERRSNHTHSIMNKKE